MWTQIAEEISRVTGKKFTIDNRRTISGGSINQSYAITGDSRTYFLKFNRASHVEMFEAEALGLKQILETQTIRVPQPICWGMADGSAYIVTEWLEFSRGCANQSWEKMGCQLAAMHKAAMHKAEGTSQFGWERNNTIGSTPQINSWTSDWAAFFAKYRIGYQLQLAKRKGGNFPEPSQVVAAVQEYLADRQPQPSLLHGDLWSGNVACTVEGEPAILDPAVYFGDREVDIAMTELFGGFPAAFYRGYNDVWSLDNGYKQRKTIYNLYHVLNHFNLFGGGYGLQAMRMIEQILG